MAQASINGLKELKKNESNMQFPQINITTEQSMDSRNALDEGPYQKTNETELKSRKSENQMKMDDFFGFSQGKNPSNA